MLICSRCSNARCQTMTSVSTPDVINCNSMSQFWLMWDIHTFDIGFGTGWYTGENILAYANDPNGFTGNNWLYGSISTGDDVGLWTFPRGLKTFVFIFVLLYQRKADQHQYV